MTFKEKLLKRKRMISSYLKWIFSFKKPIYLTMWLPQGLDKPNNIGDDLNVPLVQTISKHFVFPVQYSINSSNRECYSVIGSLIPWWINNNTIVWGSGVKSLKEMVYKKAIRFCAVRGPITRQYLIDNGIECPEIYGDPALLMPLIYHPLDVKKKYKFGVIIHEKDWEDIEFREEVISFAQENEDVCWIDIRNYNCWKDVIDKILECECVISSSLHGLILADAYRIPSIWCKFKYNFEDGYVKFHDYFLTVGRTDEIVSIENINQILSFEIPSLVSKIDIKPLIKACPFPNDLQERYVEYNRKFKGIDIIYK